MTIDYSLPKPVAGTSRATSPTETEILADVSDTIADIDTRINTKAPTASPTFTGTVAGITKAMVGLANVDDTADSAKPVSTAQQTALDTKAPTASPALTGTPTAPTAPAGTNTTQVATTAFVGTAVDNATSFVGSTTLADDESVLLIDAATHDEHILSIRHFADGSGATTQTYGVDISNRPGARSGLVGHQYSDVAPLVWLDNTDSADTIYVHNTANETLNPGGDGTGRAFHYQDHGTTRFAVEGTGRTVISPSTGVTGLAVTQNGAAVAVSVSHNGGANGVTINSSSGAAGWFPFVVSGYDYGGKVSASQNGGDTFTVQKDGTGSGRSLVVINKGTGLTLDIRSASASLFAVTAAGLPQWVAAGNQQTTVGAAGAASALPATPTKYLKVVDSAGTTLVVPAYAAA